RTASSIPALASVRASGENATKDHATLRSSSFAGRGIEAGHIRQKRRDSTRGFGGDFGALGIPGHNNARSLLDVLQGGKLPRTEAVPHFVRSAAFTRPADRPGATGRNSKPRNE